MLAAACYAIVPCEDHYIWLSVLPIAAHALPQEKGWLVWKLQEQRPDFFLLPVRMRSCETLNLSRLPLWSYLCVSVTVVFR